jgi:predicted NBD/HSP70 family sugar kinase
VAEVVHAANQGDARAEAVLQEVAFWLGVGLRPVFNLFNPELVVLGGLLAQVWKARRQRAVEGLDPSTLIAACEDPNIRPAALGDDASLIGAAELAFAPLLADPARIGS